MLVIVKKAIQKAGRRLRGRRGESITETLVSTLIAALALAMLAGAIGTSTRIILQSKEKLGAYYDENEEETGVVKMGEAAGASAPTLSITIKDSSGGAGALSDIVQDVAYYSNTTFGGTPVVSYKARQGD